MNLSWRNESSVERIPQWGVVVVLKHLLSCVMEDSTYAMLPRILGQNR